VHPAELQDDDPADDQGDADELHGRDRLTQEERPTATIATVPGPDPVVLTGLVAVT
jgi:hypothetical protein